MPKQQDRLPITRQEVLEWLHKSGYQIDDDDLLELVMLITRHIEAYHGIKL